MGLDAPAGWCQPAVNHAQPTSRVGPGQVQDLWGQEDAGLVVCGMARPFGIGGWVNWAAGGREGICWRGWAELHSKRAADAVWPAGLACVAFEFPKRSCSSLFLFTWA